MSNQRDPTAQAAKEAVNLLRKLPPKTLLLLLIGAVLIIGLLVVLSHSVTPSKQPSPAGTYLFCSWNVENFYDDQDDPKNDDRSEDYFARNPERFREKVEHLAYALLLMNDGHGPDVMALYEVENENCLNKLKDELNSRLEKAGKADAKYEHVLFKIDNTGRRFAPGIITRLGVESGRTFKFAKHPNGRTLESHLKVNDSELVVLASHWTSRVDSRNGKASSEEHANAARRMSYARDCYGRFKAILKENPDADVILCGDFNDEFSDPSMRDGLHASDNIEEVRNAIDEPRPFELLANWPKKRDPPGTIYYKGHWSIFDHICMSRGLLDNKGWSCHPETASIFAPKELRGKKSGEPFRFGDARDVERGYSDHFPVTVQLSVQGK